MRRSGEFWNETKFNPTRNALGRMRFEVRVSLTKDPEAGHVACRNGDPSASRCVGWSAACASRRRRWSGSVIGGGSRKRLSPSAVSAPGIGQPAAGKPGSSLILTERHEGAAGELVTTHEPLLFRIGEVSPDREVDAKPDEGEIAAVDRPCGRRRVAARSDDDRFSTLGRFQVRKAVVKIDPAAPVISLRPAEHGHDLECRARPRHARASMSPRSRVRRRAACRR